MAISALLRALCRAAQWCGNARNHNELSEILAAPNYVARPAECLRPGLSGQLNVGAAQMYVSEDFLRAICQGCHVSVEEPPALVLFADGSLGAGRTHSGKRSFGARYAAAMSGCSTVAAIGAATQAGTNCGSCRSEIRNIIERQVVTRAAASSATLVTPS